MKIDWKKEIKLPKSSLSALKRGPSLSVKKPSVNKPSIKRPSINAGPEIKMPRFIGDLYGDLRERHLLPLVVLLIAAIVATPFLLNKSGEDNAEAPVIAGPSTGNEAASSFTVVPAARRLRSPEKRLGHRTALDPFRVETQKQSGGKGAGGNSAGTSSGTSVGGTAAGTESTAPANAEIKVTETPEGNKELTIKESTTTTTTVPPVSEPAATETSPSPESKAPSKESTPAPNEGTVGQTEVVAYTIDIKEGEPSGELFEQQGVAPMTKLPDVKNPLVVFTGLSQDNKRALFLMTSKVTAYYGSVHCVIDKQACQMIELKPGKPVIFEFAEGEAEGRYKVVVEKIEPVVNARPGVDREVETTVRKTTTEHPAGSKGGSPSHHADALSAARRFSK
jgi:hypothetical protein